mmetsp:Transcript_56/g.178  ORF Transcript_56/g.178 Transcript_56/m.178 type:complete len:612 (-) Transcript_56:1110-2945(-)
MTHPTKPIFSMLLFDFIRLNKHSAGGAIFSEVDLKAAIDRIELIDYRQEIDVDGIRITPYVAGHVLGAAMFQVEIAGFKTLYTGDYSRKPDRHLPGAETPQAPPDVLIVESTYGVSNHSSRQEREKRFVDKVTSILYRGGRCLLPVVALGRAQELLLILDDHWSKNPKLQRFPIYQASALARRSLAVYQTYINMLNQEMQASFDSANPFMLKHVSHLGNSGSFEALGPCVVLATPSMLQSGLSRDLFEAWCDNPANGVIIADFAVQGTLAREILGAPKDILTQTGMKLPLNMSVDAISFSAHADFEQTKQFVEELEPCHVVLVHGESNEMRRLGRALATSASAKNMKTSFHTPKNCEIIEASFQSQTRANVVGMLAAQQKTSFSEVQGVLVKRDFKEILVGQSELSLYTRLRTCGVKQYQVVPTTKTLPKIRFALEAFYGRRKFTSTTLVNKREACEDGFTIEEQVSVTQSPADQNVKVRLDWISNPEADLIADGVVALVLQLEDEPPSLSSVQKQFFDAPEGIQELEAKLNIAHILMKAHFGDVHCDLGTRILSFAYGSHDVVVHIDSGQVECDCAWVCTRVLCPVNRILNVLRQLKEEKLIFEQALDVI